MPKRRRRQAGLVLVAVLVFIFVLTLAASSIVGSAATEMKREREAQLLFAGDQIRRATRAYYNTVPPGGQRRLPRRLEDLVSDERFSTPIHHLRRIYLDPMTGKSDWELVLVGEGIVGVHSRSTDVPMKKTGFAVEDGAFSGAETYSGWVFAVSLR